MIALRPLGQSQLIHRWVVQEAGPWERSDVRVLVRCVPASVRLPPI